MFVREENPHNVKKADMVVAIPSHNEAGNIAFPATQAGIGLAQYFSDLKAVLINCDNNSHDRTREVFLSTETEVPKIYLSTDPGVAGKGNNLKNLFRKVAELEAEAVVIIDADLRSVTPRWIKNLGQPLFEDFGFVCPLYVRDKYDGSLTNSIAYPLTRTLYGRRVRQPIGGDFGFNGKLNQIYHNLEAWDEAVAQFGADIWMTTLAINNNIPICQSFMGRPKIHKPKDPAADLVPMFRQSVGTIFNLMIKFSDYWKKVKWSRPTAIFGFGLGEVEAPPPVSIDKGRLYQSFRLGFDRYMDTWQVVLAEATFNKLKEVGDIPLDHFDFPCELWARILFDMAISYKDKISTHEEITDSLIPIYYGKTLSYAKKTERMSIQQAEEYIESECDVFEENKRYLIDRWKD
ncbi:MAG: glycosyl transferase [Deltaproteobacteria bacterium]|nr:glycosyl transferase [Deltaproteobacteria bacterium]